MNGSLNKYADQIIKKGIFDNVTDFNCLFDRISKVHSINNRGTELTKGDIFEIFSEALLNTKTDYQAEKVWPQKCSSIPLEILRKLNLSYDDDGWDDAAAGCDAIMHTASPFPLNHSGDENELISPAKEGTLRVLNAALSNSVERIVLTSSNAAVYAGNKHIKKFE